MGSTVISQNRLKGNMTKMGVEVYQSIHRSSNAGYYCSGVLGHTVPAMIVEPASQCFKYKIRLSCTKL